MREQVNLFVDGRQIIGTKSLLSAVISIPGEIPFSLRYIYMQEKYVTDKYEANIKCVFHLRKRKEMYIIEYSLHKSFERLGKEGVQVE